MLKNLVGFLLLISFCSCKDLTEIEATGLVRDAATQMPLDSVTVSLYEDNDGPFMGNHLLQEATTNSDGTYRFEFEYKEGPYKIFVNRRGFRYTRTETDKILGLSATFEYQEIAPLESKQYLVFDMTPQVDFTIQLKNVAPALASDHIKIEVGKSTSTRPALIWEFDGPIDLQLEGGFVDAKKFLPIKYSIRENNIWRTIQDSIFVQPGQPARYKLDY